MKIVIQAQKPRAKWLNDLLVSKRSERHADPKNPSRQKQKQEFRSQMRELA